MGYWRRREDSNLQDPAIRSEPECDRTLRILRLFSVYAQSELHRSRRSGVAFTGIDLYMNRTNRGEADSNGLLWLR